MKSDILRPTDLFSKDVRYEVPPFQRPYIWNRARQWEPLWEDVRGLAEQHLSGLTAQPHFMGAVVLSQRPNQASEAETREVVDGQQRLVTLQVLLDAARQAFAERGCRAASRLQALVQNREVYWETDPELRFKVWPTVLDQPGFRQVMNGGAPADGDRNTLLVQAHRFFSEQVGIWLDDGAEGSVDERTLALERVVVQLLQLVVIDLEPADDPHIIFETLNDRGTRLSQSDLVKNLILYRCGSSVAADALWPFGDRWWRQEISQQRLLRPRVDVFLNYWMEMRKGDVVRSSDVFADFRAWSSADGQDMEEIAGDLARVGSIYRRMEEGGYPRMAVFLYRLRAMQIRVATPVVLWLLSEDVPSSQLDKGLRALESFLVRRMLCRLNSTGLTRLFVGLLGYLKNQPLSGTGDAVVGYLGSQLANMREWPDDHMMADAFRTAPLYRLLSRDRLRMVLEGIEGGLRSGWAESGEPVPGKLTVEHIMPRGWRDGWPLPADADARDRDRLVHSIGNLTLVSGRLNAGLSNGPWREKRWTLGSFSTLYLNKSLLAEVPSDWDEAAIAARADRLCQVAREVWPHTDGFLV